MRNCLKHFRTTSVVKTVPGNRHALKGATSAKCIPVYMATDQTLADQTLAHGVSWCYKNC